MNVKAIMCDIDGTLLSSDEVVAPKTAGLIEILKLHHTDLKEIVTFGDADNDYDMTLNAGVGVVMANGSDKTKSVADYITDDNDYDGIGNYIDGTLLDYENKLPASADRAIKEARKNGHRVYICTGRSEVEVYDYIWDIGIDGVIGGNGSYVKDEDTVVMHQLITL